MSDLVSDLRGAAAMTPGQRLWVMRDAIARIKELEAAVSEMVGMSSVQERSEIARRLLGEDTDDERCARCGLHRLTHPNNGCTFE